MFRHYILRRRVPIFDVSGEILELTKRRKARLCNKLQKKATYVQKLSYSSFVVPTSILPNLCIDDTSYALKKFLEVSVLHSSRFLVEKTHLTTGGELSASRLSILGIFNLSMNPAAVFTVKHLRLNVRRAHPDFEVFSCFIDVFGDDMGSRKVLKIGCTCCKPVLNGFHSDHKVRLATTYAGELQRTPELESIVGHRFSLEILFHRYWLVEVG